MSKRVAIIDYSLGNLFSVEQALKQCGASVIITTNPEEIATADAIVLPGVGAFAEAMSYLKSNKLDLAIKNSIANGKQFLGVCLGMQLLFNSSEEFGATEGLGLIQGQIKKFKPLTTEKLHVPQVGWNTIKEPVKGIWKDTALELIQNESFMYFVHSFYAIPENKADVLCNSTYGGITYCSAVKKNNITATQFHPEKSGETGLLIYKNWLNKI